jgi:hypothetical protein
MSLMPWAIHAGGYQVPYMWRYKTEKEAMEAAEKLAYTKNVIVTVMRVTAVVNLKVNIEKVE